MSKINKDGTVHWDKDTMVEVSLHVDEHHDPNQYFARCLTSGTFPTVQVLDDRYPDPVVCTPLASPCTIWREIASDAAPQHIHGVAFDVRDASPTFGTYSIQACLRGTYEVIDRRTNVCVEQFYDHATALTWVGKYTCSECGLPVLESSAECSGQHFSANEEASFTF